VLQAMGVHLAATGRSLAKGGGSREQGTTVRVRSGVVAVQSRASLRVNTVASGAGAEPGFTISGFFESLRPAPAVFAPYAEALRAAGLPG
jgi:hypothetical protein